MIVLWKCIFEQDLKLGKEEKWGRVVVTVLVVVNLIFIDNIFEALEILCEFSVFGFKHLTSKGLVDTIAVHSAGRMIPRT